MMEGTTRQENHKTSDRWIPSACSMCYGACSIRGHVVNDTLVKIEGNPDSVIGSGRLCAKGASGIMMEYDPHRVKVPLKRTNPQKGLGVDPGWVEISWDEALDTVVEKMREVYADDPRTLVDQSTTTTPHTHQPAGFMLTAAFGVDTHFVGGGAIHCGQAAHMLAGLMHASWSMVPDWPLCNYALYFGCSKGHSAGHVANPNAQGAADARARGMKLVVVDPMCNFASAKANEWVPIRVGTDGALALALANVLVNELGLYDRTYLKLYTNAPYLVGPDGHYCRDKDTNKPLVWDAVHGVSKTFDDPSVAEFAIEGRYTVDGTACQPGFQILKEHLKKYTPEHAAEITTVPAANIRRIAREFGEAARIGSTIIIEGTEYPYRPAAAIFFRGAQGHKSSTWTGVAIELLNTLVGSGDVPGGCLGFNPVCHGHPNTGRPYYEPYACPDGLMIADLWMSTHKAYPPHEAVAPETLGLQGIFPWAMMSPFLASSDQEEWWQKFKLLHRPRMMLNFGANSVMSVGNKDIVAETLKKLEFIVSFDIFLNETTDFADIVLPDTTYMERLEPSANFPFIFNHPAGMGEWSWPIRQPLVPVDGQQREYTRVIYEILDRMGLREPANMALNLWFRLQGEYKLARDVKYDFDEVCDRVLRCNFGDEHGLAWFKEHGVISWPKKAEEVYWRTRVPVRVPVYFEMVQSSGEQARRAARQLGLEEEMDFSQYHSLPDWHPCPSHQVKDAQYDLWAFYYRDILHTNSLTMENPWLDEAAQMNPYSYFITIHAEAGARNGLKDGDVVWVESNTGRKIKGKLKLSEGIHPEGLGVAACAGHWTNGQPIARGKGIFFNDLIEIDYEHMDPVNLNMDLCIKVKVYGA